MVRAQGVSVTPALALTNSRPAPPLPAPDVAYTYEAMYAVAFSDCSDSHLSWMLADPYTVGFCRHSLSVEQNRRALKAR